MRQPKDAQEAVQQIRILERASEVSRELQHGGNYSAYEQEPGVWGIYKRELEGKPDTTYTVDLNRQTCTCPYFADNGFCKHLYGLQARLDEDAADESLEAQCAAYERKMQDCELETTGTDPHYWLDPR